MLANSYRETSSPRLIPHETHPLAQKSLEDQRITRKGDPDSKITRKMVAPSGKCPSKSATTPTLTCSSNLYRCLERRLGVLLRRSYNKRDLVPTKNKLHIKYLELKAVILDIKEFQDLCSNKIVFIATGKATVVAYINKERGTRSGPLCRES